MNPKPQNQGPLRVGDTFLERYQILGVMGRGGFGCVYRARSQFMGREVAIKVLDRQTKLTDEMRARGQREAVILGQLEHPNIVRVHEAEVSPDGHLYIVMELLEGMTLSERLRSLGKFEVREGLEMLEKLCSALESAHKIKAVHRDLKPANIFICKDGSPRILDFGIGKIAGTAGWQTAPNMVVGTSLYISPEQIRGQPASHLSDIYALGLVAFQMFHGNHPLLLQEPDANLRDPQVVWQLQIKSRAPRLDRVVPDFPEHIARWVNTALVKDPGQRFQSAGEMAEKARVALLRLDADAGLVSGRSPDARSTPDESAPEDAGRESAQSQNTAKVDLRKTEKLFDEGESDVQLSQPLDVTGPTADRRPGRSVSPAENAPTAPQDEARSPQSNSPSAAPTRNEPAAHRAPPLTDEPTTGMSQNVTRTVSLPGVPKPWTASRPRLASVLAIVIGSLVGIGVIFALAPKKNEDSEAASGEIVVESVEAEKGPTEEEKSQLTETPKAEETRPDPAPAPQKVAPPRPSSRTKASPSPTPTPSDPPKTQPTTTPSPSPTKVEPPNPAPPKPSQKPAPDTSAPAVPDSGLW